MFCMHPESDVRWVAVNRLAYIHVHAVDVEDVSGPECEQMLRKAQMIWGERGPEAVQPLHYGDGTEQGSSLDPSAARHAFYCACGIRIMVRVAMGNDYGIRAAQVVSDALHLRQGARPRIYMKHATVVLYEEAAAAAGLIHGGMPPAACSEERHAESHVSFIRDAVFRYWSRPPVRRSVFT